MQKKPISRANIPPLPTEVSKWQKASMDLVELKFKVHHTLKQFSDEERQSDQYKELTDILKGIIVHVMDDNAVHTDVPANGAVNGYPVIPEPLHVSIPADIHNDKNHSSKKSWLSNLTKYITKPNILIGLIGSAITATIPFVPEIIKFIVHIFTGTP